MNLGLRDTRGVPMGTKKLSSGAYEGWWRRVAGYLARTVGFALAYLVATGLGRVAVPEGSAVSMAWPAAGVAALWFLAQRRGPLGRRALDVLALLAVSLSAGGSPVTMASTAVAALAQVAVFTLLFSRWLPELWGPARDQPVSRLSHLVRLLVIAALAAIAGTLLGPVLAGLADGTDPVPAAVVWLAGSTVSMVLFTAAGLGLGSHLRTGWLTAWRTTSPARRAEYLTVVVVSAVAYGAGFGLSHGLPLAFPLIVMTVWAALRLHTTFVLLHDLAFGAVAVVLTLRGTGPFAAVADSATRSLILQLFVGVIAVVGLAVALNRDERIALLDDLNNARTASIDQATMLRTIVDAMGDGLAVLDDQGRYVLRNPAAGRLLGAAEGADYGLYRTDGTLVPADQLPYRRALATGRAHAMDLVVRNPGVPDGRTLAVSATPLPPDSSGTRYTVSVYHDITAERRHREELASFAGVVAHDLLDPLTTISGWTEDLTDTIYTAPDRAADRVQRVHRAAARMHHVIDGLLDYTNARDTALRPQTVDLTALTQDIAAARTDQAESTGGVVPYVLAGNLHPVYADPILTRLLVDHLVSNAIKYTAPQVTPHIVVATDVVGDLIRVQIRDNGIGIPPGQHHVIFDDFHQAHRGAGFKGTGLGLATCKRIVERHGGSIFAMDNPQGYGTSLVFTLPAAHQYAPYGTDTPAYASA
jgi:PAS domain S-box-containing protein